MTSHEVEFGTYVFGNFVGPAEKWFAWFPVKLWYGKRVWLRRIYRRRLVKKPFLLGSDWECWVYAEGPKG